MPEHDKPKGYQAGLEFDAAQKQYPGYAVGIELADAAPAPEPGETQHISPDGFSHTDYGEPETRNTAEFIRPQGADFLEVPEPEAQQMRRPDYYEPPHGYKAGINFTSTWEYRPGYAVGIEFADEAPEPSDGRTLKPVGFSHTAYGAPEIRNTQLLVKAAGYNGLSFGTPFTRNTADFIRPKGGDYLQVPQPDRVELLHRPIYPQGWRSEAHGTGRIYNLIQYVTSAGNISPRLAFGRPTIENLNRYLNISGIDSLKFGTATVTHETRYLYPSMPNRLAFGTPWASHSPRTIEAGGLYATKLGNPVVAGTRHIGAIGWDSQAFGTRIIPEIQTVYPQGMAGQWGWPTVYNHDWHVTPKGFMSTVSEAERFGTAYFYNSRQYTQAFHSELSDATGEKFGVWTEIKNRNRYVTTHGHDSMVVQRQYIENTARTLEPAGFDSQAFGQQFIAAGVRDLRLDGIEPPYVSGWTAVYNGARVIQTRGFDSSLVPADGYVENTRRYFNRIGNFDSLEAGQPFIADAIRELSIERRYSIEPPLVPMPLIDHRVKYIEPAGLDRLNMGEPFLHIRWNKLHPRSGDLSQYGMPAVRNLTPELYFHGKDMQEFGQASVHLYTRYIQPDGPLTQQFGRPHARDKRSWIYPLTQDFASFSTKNHVYNERPDPPGVQRIQPRSIPQSESELRQKFGTPNFNQQVIYHHQTQESLRMGSPEIKSNVIRIEGGIYDYFSTGKPEVTLRNRTIDLEGQGIDNTITLGKPRFSPFTIWATTDVPAQANDNHIPPGQPFRPIGMNENGTWNKGFGRPDVTLQHRSITSVRVNQPEIMFGTHTVRLSRVIVEPKGWQLSRVGWHEVPHFIRETEQYNSPDCAEFGRAEVKRPPYTGPQEIKPIGIAGAFGQTLIEHFNRSLPVSGWDSMSMGASGAGPQYMRQRLWVGAPDWPHMQGFDVLKAGEPWISFAVREVKPEGFDSFTMDYDLNNFDARMRVQVPWWSQPNPEPAAQVETAGHDSAAAGLPEIKNKVHYIRPDGNAEVFRKGAGNA